MKIGNVEIANPLVLAPMAGATTKTFRTICRENGAGYVISEMISDKAILYANKKTFDMLQIDPRERPMAIQVFGSDYKSITDASKIIYERVKPDIIDVNMGCPVAKVLKSGAGSALLCDPNKVYNIVKSLKNQLPIPVTIKIRAGIDLRSINCDTISAIATKAGVDAIAIHARTKSQLYSGFANYEYIKMVKDNTDKIVIGNGDLNSFNDVLKMQEIAHPDMYMVGRSALGNPWIFQEINARLQNTPYAPVSLKTRLEMLLRHAFDLCQEKGEHLAMIEMRTMAPTYLKNLPGIKPYRITLTMIATYKDLESICHEYYQSILIDNKKD